MKKVHHKWNLIQMKHPLKLLKNKVHLVERILETFIDC